MSTEIGKVGPLRRVPAESVDLTDDKPTVHVYASRDGIELLAEPVVLTPGEAVALINILVKALHAASILFAPEPAGILMRGEPSVIENCTVINTGSTTGSKP